MKRKPTITDTIHSRRAPYRISRGTAIVVLSLVTFAAWTALTGMAALLADDHSWTPATVTLPRQEDQLTDEDRIRLCSDKDIDCPEEKSAAKPAASVRPKTAPVARVSSISGKTVVHGTVTTYQAVPGQTDSTPCQGAMPGVDFCDPPFRIAANNCLRLGTKVEIRGRQYVVADRLNSRYGCDRFDLLTDGENFKLTGEPVEVM
jgi:hypothetical protein